MKRNSPGYISLVFLVLFTCTFSFRQGVAATGNFSHIPTEVYKSFEKRAQDCTPEDTDLFENESEDETEDEAAASFEAISCQGGNSLLFDRILSSANISSFATSSSHSDIKNPLYIVMRSFRI